MTFLKNILRNKNSNLILAIDIGSLNLRAIVSEDSVVKKIYKSPSEGVTFGLIDNPKDLKRSLEKLLTEITKDFEFIPSKVIVCVGSIQQESVSINIRTFTKRTDGVISNLDLDEIKEEAKKKLHLNIDKIILHEINVRNKVDDEEVIGDIKNHIGKKIDSKVMFVIENKNLVDTINSIFDELGIEVNSVVSGILAESLVSLNKKEKRFGSMLLNIGHHVSSLIVYEQNAPIMLASIKMGGENITSDLALLLRVGIDEAELLKRGEAALSKNKKNAEIIESRIEFLSEKINAKLESINRKELLSGGAVLTGETSKLKNIENTIRYSLKIPARVLEWKLHGNEYVRCYGTTLMYDSLQEVSLYQKLIGNSIDRFVMFIKKFLP